MAGPNILYLHVTVYRNVHNQIENIPKKVRNVISSDFFFKVLKGFYVNVYSLLKY